MLLKLLSRMDRGNFSNAVISLGDDGTVGPAIRELGVPVDTLGIRSSRALMTGLHQLSQVIKYHRPQVLQTWMYHANLLGGLAALPLRKVPVVWNLRRGWLDRRIDKRTTLWTSRACATLSSWLPSRIVCCSEAARVWHTADGYSRGKMLVIPNGFDLDAFRPDACARAAIRQELSVDAETVLVGLVARFDPTKDHRNFVRAAAIAGARHPDIRFVLCGTGVDWDNSELAQWIDEAQLRHRVHLLGNRNDVPRLIAALDIAVSSSRIESFPNVVGEAMACGVASVVTDVGDSRRIVDGTAEVVPPENPEALANGIDKLCRAGAAGRAELGIAARKRVSEHFSLNAITHQYERLYEELSTPCAA